MSGQQIGMVVGGIVGAFFGAPQLGMAIGGFIGGVIDPTKIEGPHIGDGSQQSSNEGIPIPWILGTAGWIQGNIVQKSARREVKKEDDGKGGPVTVIYEAHQDFAIMICESSETRDSVIVGVQIVRVNGKIVYDMRAGKNMGAENNKFLRNHTFHYGAEDQGPDSTLEAITGVGNTPSYRGVLLMVGRDINLSQYGDAIPTYEFVVVSEGEVITETETALAPPTYGRFVNADWPLADPTTHYTYVGTRSDITGAGSPAFEAETIEEIIEHFSDAQYGFAGSPSVYLGYCSRTPLSGAGLPQSNGIHPAVPQDDVTESFSLILAYNNFPAISFFTGSAGDTYCPILPIQTSTEEFYADRDGHLMAKYGVASGSGPAWLKGVGNCSPEISSIYGIPALYISVYPRRSPPSTATGDPCILGFPVSLPDDPNSVIDCEGNVTPQPEYSPTMQAGMLALQKEATTLIGTGQTVYTKRTLGPVILSSDPNNTQAFWEAAYAREVAAGRMAAGLIWNTNYPVNPVSAFEGVYTTTSLESDSITVATTITKIAGRGGLGTSKIDVNDVDQVLMGYPIQSTYNGADCLRPLLAAYSLYGSEYDAQLHFHKHGEAIEIVVDPLDFIEGSDDTYKNTREQLKEYPRKVSVSYIDIDQDYTVRPQWAYRTTPDIRAIGEESIQVPVAMTGDQGAQIAEIAMKVYSARSQGTLTFSVPYVGTSEYLHLVAGAPFGLDGKRYVVSKFALSDNVIQIEGVYDRQSAYTSVATGVPALPPTPPPSTIGGVTLCAILNAPPLRDQDDRVGLYIAVAGLLDSWQGCLLQMSSDDEASWQTAIASMTEASTIGVLTASLPDAAAEGDDVTNTLRVAVHGGELNSITLQQYLSEGNPCAIVKPVTSAQVELLQFLDADETSAGHYDLTTLARGRLGTEPIDHAAGARFCALDAFYFLELPSSLIGRTLQFRPVTFGTAPENNAIYEVLFDPCVSQTELAPTFLGSSIISDTLTLTVVARHRLGTDVAPIESINFNGFRWSITDGVNTATQDTDRLTPTASFDITGWGSPIDVSVSQLNRITGAGPALEETI